jgi:hypothetical protein
MTTSRRWRLAARPVGEIKTGDFQLVDAPIPGYFDFINSTSSSVRRNHVAGPHNTPWE